MAAHGGSDPWQPFSSALANLWAGWPETALVVGEHLGWWLALGLILAFVPYPGIPCIRRNAGAPGNSNCNVSGKS